MQMPEMSLFEWQQKYGTLVACQKALIEMRWPDGFVCPCCSSKKYTFISTRYDFECLECGRQTSVVSGTIFQSSNVPLTKWFLAIYLCASDKGGISALRLSKELDVCWLTAHRMLRKLRTVMADRDSLYRLCGQIELDDALVGGKRHGKRGRGALGKTPIVVAVERRELKKKKRRTEVAGYMAIDVLENGIKSESVDAFIACKITQVSKQLIRTDALPSLNVIAKNHTHLKKVTSPEEANSWLPLVHIVIGNLKTFINGTFHGVSAKYLREYLAEFCYRFNRRMRERELPMRLLNACKEHAPVSLTAIC